ncbi:MAG: glycosyltransferase [Anaerolineales bacterium]|nr:glycosyltransferase [Anaerolineales bacterium]
MRVLYFVGALEIGGLERYVTRMALRARATGVFEPVVCCLHEKRGPFLQVLQGAGVSVYQAPVNWRRTPGALHEFSRLIRQIRPSLVHSQSNFSLLQQFLAVRLAGAAAFCVTERSEYVLKGAARLRRMLQFHLLNVFGGHYSANSASTALHVARQSKGDVQKVQVLPNGVAIIPPDDEQRARIRAQLGWKADDIGLGYISNLRPGKGQDLFIQALHTLYTEGLSVRGCLLGSGPERDILKKQLQELHLAQVVDMPGTVSNVEDYLQAFDITALFSVREGMPNAVLEAMAAGKAVIGTPAGGIPEMFDKGKAGLVVPRELQAITDGLRLLVQDGNLRQKLGRNAVYRVERSFGLEKTFFELYRYYQEIAC